MTFTQLRVAGESWPITTDSAHVDVGAHRRTQGVGRLHKGAQRQPGLFNLQPLLRVPFAQPPIVVSTRSFTALDCTAPPVDRVITWYRDDVLTVEGIEPRRRDQGAQQFQSVPCDTAVIIIGKKGEWDHDRCAQT